MANPLQILGVSADSGPDEIRRRYLELVRQHPPDRDPKRFAEIRRAYDQLSDPVRQLENMLFELDSIDSIDCILGGLHERLRQRVHSDRLIVVLGQRLMLTSHEIEDILDRVRAWLQETNEDLDHPQIVALSEQLAEGSSSRDASVPSSNSAGLLEMANSFTALRHEIKLQTKGLRGLKTHLESNQQSVEKAVERAVDELESTRREVLRSADESTLAAARELIMGLLDVDEALGQAVKTTEQALIPPDNSRTTAAFLMDELEREIRRLPSWKRMWLGGFRETMRERLEMAPALPSPPSQPETLEGLRLLHARVRRVLSEAEVEQTHCIGNRVEPRTMRVVEVIDDPNLPPETVVSETRAGYQWKGVTLRPAEVRATKSLAFQQG